MVNNEANDQLEADKENLVKFEEDYEQKVKDYETKIQSNSLLLKEIKLRMGTQEAQYEVINKLILEYDQKSDEFESLFGQIDNLIKTQSENKQTITEYQSELSVSFSKLEEHDKALNDLENEKKTLAKNKKFKEAKRIKDLIVMKTNKKANLEKRVEEIKHLKEDVETQNAKEAEMYEQLLGQQTEAEKDLKFLEYKIAVKKYQQVLNFISNDHPDKEEQEVLDTLSQEISDMENKYGFTLEEQEQHQEEEEQIIETTKDNDENKQHEQGCETESSNDEKSIENPK